MKFTSTNGKSEAVPFLEAMKNGLAPDGGLYMPQSIPVLPEFFWGAASKLSFNEIASQMALPYLEGELPAERIKAVVNDAFNFPVELKKIKGNQFILELFHGPTLAFKDFGARFMARLFSEMAQEEGKKVTILVATSGDTGSAVAHGFYKVPGVRVCLLYPRGKVSPLQEKQMTTLGENIMAFEVDGVFDDCQRMVKQAFLDKTLNDKIQLSSANSINIARLLPQSFYYAYAFSRLNNGSYKTVFSVPSGNFGNLTGGLLAMKMGMPVHHFIAATNRNRVVPDYLEGGDFTPADSVQTISNAMDVGNPSNFIRIKKLFNESDSEIRKQISGYSYSDEETISTMRYLVDNYGYLACPHTSIGQRAASEYQDNESENVQTVTLATAHPVKFRDVIEKKINRDVKIPERLKEALHRDKKAISIKSEFDEFKELLLDRF